MNKLRETGIVKKLVGGIALFLILIAAAIWAGFFAGEGKYDITGPANVRFVGQEKTKLTINNNITSEYLYRISNESANKKITVNFIDTMAAKDSDVTVFHPKSVWGGAGMACGKPMVSADKNTVKVNFYYSKGYLVDTLGKEQASEEVNKFFRYCLVLSTYGKSALSSEEGKAFANLETEYKTKQLINL